MGAVGRDLLALGGGQPGGPNLGVGFVIFMAVVFVSIAIYGRVKARAQRQVNPDDPEARADPLDDSPRQ